MGINFHFCLSFIRHYAGATRIDVLHSPFVFKLYNTCIRRQKTDANISEIEKLRAQLKRDLRIITQKDFGAGAAISPNKKRTIKSIATIDAKQPRIQQIFYFLITHLQCKSILELGTSLGLTTVYLAKATDGNVTSIEGSEEIANVAKENLKKLSVANANIITGNFDEVLPEVLKNPETLDLVYIDGNHRYKPTLRYFNLLLPKMHNNSVMIFDDIYWSKEMTQAWREIKQHKSVTVTIDLFFVGLVLFRKEQVREDFKLRVL